MDSTSFELNDKEKVRRAACAPHIGAKPCESRFLVPDPPSISFTFSVGPLSVDLGLPRSYLSAMLLALQIG